MFMLIELAARPIQYIRYSVRLMFIAIVTFTFFVIGEGGRLLVEKILSLIIRIRKKHNNLSITKSPSAAA